MHLERKATYTLSIILAAFLAILLRVWTLSVFQREERMAEAQKPRQRTVLLRAERGKILDRFGIPLAINKIAYNAAVYYTEIAEIPGVSWVAGPDGKKVKTYPRKEYIQRFSSKLGEILHLDPERIEDLIHAKASLFPHAPYIIKAGISEGEHYQLKALERSWPGLHAEIASLRQYPLGKTAAHILGTMGAINTKEYASIAREMKELEEAISLYEQGEGPLALGFSSFEKSYQRLYELKEKAYSLTDLVGKTGIEGKFEEELRGFFGKKTFEVDQKGKRIREIHNSKEPLHGKEIVLTLSAELQQFAEKLLEENELIREGKSRWLDPKDKKRKGQKQPWVKGGALVALDPNTGEVLAMASHPSFDPNDFIPSPDPARNNVKQKALIKWLENKEFIASLWDGKEAGEKGILTWEQYLDALLPLDHPIREFFKKYDDVKKAIELQEDFETLLYFSRLSPLALLKEIGSDEGLSLPKEALSSLKRVKSALKDIESEEDQLFAIDLCRVAVDATRFTDSLIEKLGKTKLSYFRRLSQAFQRVEEVLRKEAMEAFKKGEFQNWKRENQKAFLALKRKEEKEKKTYARPYIDYLDKKEKELFSNYWEKEKYRLIIEKLTLPTLDPDIDLLQTASQGLVEEERLFFLKTLRSFKEMQRPLFGNYPKIKKQEAFEQELAAAFYPPFGVGYLRSFAYQASSPLGSIFKLVVGHEALKQKVPHFKVIDQIGIQEKGEIVCYFEDRTPYPRIYKGGRLPRSSAMNIGPVDLIGAIEQSSNPYFSILAGDYLKNPDDLSAAAKAFGFGQKTAIELTGESSGFVPTDLSKNRTGLYSFAIGQHTFLATPLQSALMLSSLGNRGKLLKPKIVLRKRGTSSKKELFDAFSPQNTFAKEELEAIGLYFPLFTEPFNAKIDSETAETHSLVQRELWLPPYAGAELCNGMEKVIWGAKGSARPGAIRTLIKNPSYLKNYLSLKGEMIGKTSTSQILYNLNATPSSKAEMYKHIWFGAISFAPSSSKEKWENPELVVIVFLRFGDSGKEAAPLASEVICKWREIKKKHGV